MLTPFAAERHVVRSAGALDRGDASNQSSKPTPRSIPRGARTAVVGYGNQGRPWALNATPASTSPCRVRAGRARRRERRRLRHHRARCGLRVRRPLHPHPRRRDPVAPDPTVQRRARRRREQLRCAFDQFEPGCDVGMVAPRMLGPEVRRCFEEGIGFITAFGVHRDDDSHCTAAHPRRRQGDRWPPPGCDQRADRRQEAVLDLAVEQALSTALSRVSRCSRRSCSSRDPDRGDHHRARAVGRGRAHLPLDA